jgi:hypothetical protein
MDGPISEVLAFLTKGWVYIGGVVAGVIAKVSTELLMNRKLSLLQWIGIVGVSIFCGYVCAVYCDVKGYQQEAKYLVPLLTLLGEKGMIYISTNYRKIIDAILLTFKK